MSEVRTGTAELVKQFPVEHSPTYRTRWEFRLRQQDQAAGNDGHNKIVRLDEWFDGRIVDGHEYRIEGHPDDEGRLAADRIDDLVTGSTFVRPKRLQWAHHLRNTATFEGKVVDAESFEQPAGPGQDGRRRCGWRFDVRVPHECSNPPTNRRSVYLFEGKEFGPAVVEGDQVRVDGVEDEHHVVRARHVTDTQTGVKITATVEALRWQRFLSFLLWGSVVAGLVASAYLIAVRANGLVWLTAAASVLAVVAAVLVTRRFQISWKEAAGYCAVWVFLGFFGAAAFVIARTAITAFTEW